MKSLKTNELLVLVIILAGIIGTAADDCTSANNPTNYKYKAPSSLGPFYDMINRFINTVQPNNVPYDELQTLINKSKTNDIDLSSAGNVWSLIKPVVLYEIGFVVLFLIGLVFVVCMPFVGSLFGCCRACGNCGGKAFQKEPVSTGWCCCNFLCLFVIFGIITCGCVFYGLNDYSAWNEVPKVRDNLSNQLDFIVYFANTFLDNITDTVNQQFQSLVGSIEDQLDMINGTFKSTFMTMAGLQAFQNLGTTFNGTLNATNVLLLSVSNINANASALSVSTLHELQVLNSANLYNPSAYNSSDASTDIANYTDYPMEVYLSGTEVGLNTFSNRLDFSSNSNFQSALSAVGRSIQNVMNQANDAMTQVEQAKSTLMQNLDSFQQGLNNITNSTLQFKCNARDHLSQSTLNQYSWAEYVPLVLIVPIALLLLCIFIGLLCGMCSYHSKTPPYERSGFSSCTSCCLMCGVSFAFMFSYILMLLTMLFFVIGYFSKTLVCDPLFEDQSYDMFDFVQRNWLQTVGGSGFNINITNTIVSCKADNTLYNALNIDQIFNVSEIRGYTDKVISSLDPNSFADLFNTGDLFQGADPVVLNNAKMLLNNLTEQVDRYNTTVLSHVPTIAFANLKSAYDYLRLHSNSNLSTVEGLQHDLEYLVNLTEIGKPDAAALTSSIAETIRLINVALNVTQYPNATLENFKSYVKTIINNFTNSVETFETSTLDAIVNRIGRCGPLYDAYMGLGDVLCKEILYPFQGIWMSLGWCLLFYIPAIIFSVTLSKYFRKMDKPDYKDVNNRPPQDQGPIQAFSVPVQPQPQYNGWTRNQVHPTMPHQQYDGLPMQSMGYQQAPTPLKGRGLYERPPPEYNNWTNK